MKPDYGPTLGQLLAPRWHTATPLVRRTAIAAGIALLAAIVAAVLSLENASFSHGGRVPFSFSYRGLYRTTPDAGGFVRVARRHSDGTLRDSFAVGPLLLPPYTGGVAGELPVYAASYIAELSRRYDGFMLRGEGRAKVNSLPAYTVFYTFVLQGRRMYGRDALLVAERPGAREGVDIVMWTRALKASKLSSPLEIGGSGILQRPLKSFTLE